MRSEFPSRSAFCVFFTTECEGTVPAWNDAQGWPVIYSTEREAQIEIVDDLQDRLLQFIAGEREFGDAITIEEFVLPVEVWPDGSISTEDGSVFGRSC